MNKKGAPDLIEFLDFIDPDSELDRQEVLRDITVVSLIKSVELALEKIPEEKRNPILVELDKLEQFDFGKIYTIIENDIDKDEFLETVQKQAIEVRTDYMLTHVENLSDEKRKESFEKFPHFLKYF